MDPVLIGGIAAACVSLSLGHLAVPWLKRRFAEPNSSSSATLRALHASKVGTPTLGGLFLVAGIVAGALASCGVRHTHVQVGLWLVVGLAIVGAIDDLVKLRGKRRGLPPRAKLAAQVLVVLPACIWGHVEMHSANVPLSAGATLNAAPILMDWLSLVMCLLVVLAATNAVNLADGLDGLASGCAIVAVAALLAAEMLASAPSLSAEPASSALFRHAASERWIMAAALVGSAAGFLWFNRHPARVFMGDCGSLPMGGLIGYLAWTSELPFTAAIACGVFAVELASVVLQATWFRWTGRRILRCAPLHHHFQFLGWREPSVVATFWLATAACGTLSVALACWGGTGRTRADSPIATVVAQAVSEASP